MAALDWLAAGSWDFLSPPNCAPEVFGNARGTLEGSRRAFSADFIRKLTDDFRLYGRQAIEKVSKNAARGIHWFRKEFKVEHTAGLKGLSDEELEQVIAVLREMVDARAGESAKLIEGEAEVVPSLQRLM
jgi:hypothetical protein